MSHCEYSDVMLIVDWILFVLAWVHTSGFSNVSNFSNNLIKKGNYISCAPLWHVQHCQTSDRKSFILIIDDYLQKTLLSFSPEMWWVYHYIQRTSLLYEWLVMLLQRYVVVEFQKNENPARYARNAWLVRAARFTEAFQGVEATSDMAPQLIFSLNTDRQIKAWQFDTGTIQFFWFSLEFFATATFVPKNQAMDRVVNEWQSDIRPPLERPLIFASYNEVWKIKTPKIQK